MNIANIQRYIKKASKSVCRFKILAIGFDKKGDCIGNSTNYPRMLKTMGGLHAEINLIRRYGNAIKKIVILRVGHSGNLLPIKPCINCEKVMNKLGIKLFTIDEVA